MAPSGTKKRGAKTGKTPRPAPTRRRERHAVPRRRDAAPTRNDEVEGPAPADAVSLDAADPHIPTIVGVGASA